jgi:hypothetical protein
LTGTVRLNLDPCGNRYSERQLLEVLQACGFAWTLTASNWQNIRTVMQLGNDVSATGPQSDEILPPSRAVNTDEAVFDLEAAYSSPSKCDETTSFSHWLQRSNTGELGETILSGSDLSLVLDWKIASAGSTLSQGQRQLLCLARALLPLFFDSDRDGGPALNRVVLIDEATAAVDPAAEAALVSVLSKYFAGDTVSRSAGSASTVSSPGRGCTLIMICHRKDGIRKLCNKVSVL